MTIANPTLGLVPRDPTGSAPHPDNWSVGAYGELIYGGGTAFSSAQHPSSEVIDGTGVTVGRQFKCTGALASGTIAVTHAGDYLVELDLYDFSCGAASGNVQFTIQMAPTDGASGTFAALDATDAGGGGRLQVIRLALTTKESIRVAGVQHLNANSAVRAIVTSAAGDVITITEGRLRVTKVADNDPVTPGATA